VNPSDNEYVRIIDPRKLTILL